MTTLKNVLLVNAVTSGLTGAGLIFFPFPIATIFGAFEIGPFVGAGIFLFLFAAFVAFVASQKIIREKAVRVIIMLDILWVVASLGIVILQAFGLTILGYVLISAVAGWVGLMAYLQSNGLKQPVQQNN
jgi:hypothetical protein